MDSEMKSRLSTDNFNQAAYGAGYNIKDILSKPGCKLAAFNALREALMAATKTSYQD